MPGYDCEPCGWSCWLRDADDLAVNVEQHLGSDAHLEQIAETDGDVPS